MTKELSIGSNGYYFIDNFHVDKEDYEKEKLRQKLDKILPVDNPLLTN